MIVFTGRDNRFTRFVERNGHRLAGATICRVRGHRHSRYIWGACDRCFQFYDKPVPLTEAQRAHIRRMDMSIPPLTED